MGILNTIKKWLGSNIPPADDGLYFYIKLQRSGEIVQLRIDPKYDLSRNYDTGGFTTRKVVAGGRTYQRANITLWFDDQRHLINAEVTGGKLVDKSEWQEQQHLPVED